MLRRNRKVIQSLITMGAIAAVNVPSGVCLLGVEMIGRPRVDRRKLGVVSTLALSGLLLGTNVRAAPPPIDDAAYLRPARLVPVESGRRLNLYCIGSGTPTVVLEAGHGDGLTTWARVQPAISKLTRVCSYDRAGFGFSDPPKKPGTIQQAADDLRALLVNASIRPPFVLVGHSMGGMIVRLYAAEHPDDVAGMVLVDATHEQQAQGYNRVDGRSRADWDRANQQDFRESERCVTAAASGRLAKGALLYDMCAAEYDPNFGPRLNAQLIRQSLGYGAQRAMVWEQESTFYISAEQLAAMPGDYGSKPLLVLHRGPDPKRKGQSQEQADNEYRMLVGLHDDVAARSTEGVSRSVPRTGHYIQLQAPDAVVEGIAHILSQVSARAPKR